MDLQELCNFASAERMRHASTITEAMQRIVNWFYALPTQFEEETLKEETLIALKNGDDLFECSFSLKDNETEISLYNSKSIRKKYKLSQLELDMLSNLTNLLPGTLVSICQFLYVGSPAQINFYIENDLNYHNFKKATENLDLEIDYDYDFDITVDGDHLVVISMYPLNENV